MVRRGEKGAFSRGCDLTKVMPKKVEGRLLGPQVGQGRGASWKALEQRLCA